MLQIEGVSKSFPAGSGKRTTVLKDISLTVTPGRSTGLVGESGSGKSTIIRVALGLQKPDTGSVTFEGQDVFSLSRERQLHFRRHVQLVFQDPYASLNPRMTIEELVGEGLIIHGIERTAAGRRNKVVEMLRMVGIGEDALARYPRSLSGGQRQRIAIARALIVRPRLLICDEPVSALDVSVQAQVINLLQDMQREMNLGILFVAHDLAVVRHLCEEIAVLEKGTIVERGDRTAIFDNPQHPYSRSLLEAVPLPDPDIARLRREQRQMKSAG